ncbi:MAG: GDSL-type esterase/lipase family protein [Chloroflexota bacterium]|jgi:lysophospholipase L1-like esterase
MNHVGAKKWPYLLLAFLLVCLGISLLLNLLLYEQATVYYRQLRETRLDPLGLQVYDSEATAMPSQQADHLKFIFFGDSRAAEWPEPDLDGFAFINRGIGAQTSTQTAARFSHHIQPLQPDVVLLQVGINDLTTIPLYPEQKRRIVTNCQQNIAEIVQRSVAMGSTVIVTTIFPVGDPPLARRPFWSDDITQAVAEVNEYIHSLAGPNVIVFDAYAILANEDGLVQSDYKRDELHLSEAGYEALNQALQTLLIKG